MSNTQETSFWKSGHWPTLVTAMPEIVTSAMTHSSVK